MPGSEESQYRDEKGQLAGGTTAHAPGIQQGDDLSALVDATSAEEAAAALAERRDDVAATQEPGSLPGREGPN